MSFFSFSFIFLLATFAIASKNISYNNPHFADGRNTIVMLFQWKFEDIGKECEHFLGPMGYGGVIVRTINTCIVFWLHKLLHICTYNFY